MTPLGNPVQLCTLPREMKTDCLIAVAIQAKLLAEKYDYIYEHYLVGAKDVHDMIVPVFIFIYNKQEAEDWLLDMKTFQGFNVLVIGTTEAARQIDLKIKPSIV